MLEYCLIIMAIVLIFFTLVMIGLSVVQWCARKKYRDNTKSLDYNEASSKIASPYQERISVSLPPLPPYFFVTKNNYYDAFVDYV